MNKHASLIRTSYPGRDKKADLDSLASLAALTCDVPAVLISLRNEKGQRILFNHGLNITKSDHFASFCHYTEAGKVLTELANVTTNPRFSTNVLVKRSPFIQFYAGIPLINQQGEVLGTLCLFDTSPRKLSNSQKKGIRILAKQIVLHFKFQEQKNQMMASEKHHRELFHNTKGLFCTHDMSGTILSLNPASAESMERTEKDLLGTNLCHLLPSHHKKLFDEYLRRIASEKVVEGVMHIISASGKDKYWAYRNVRIDSAGKASYVVGLSQDITYLIQVEKELKASRAKEVELRKSRELFFTSMSHELRTPLNAISGFTRLMLKNKLTQTQQEYINAINSAGENLLVVVNDILDMGKLEASKMVFEKITFQPLEIVSSAMDLLKNQAYDKGIQLIKKIDTTVPDFVLGDPIRLRQILINLIGNALKFTEKGSVTVGLVVKKGKNRQLDFILTISDTGIGIAPEKLSLLFTTYSQVSADITRKYGGSGLGLSIVKRLVEGQNGTVLAKSEPGKGSTFTVRIPYEKNLLKNFLPKKNKKNTLITPVNKLRILLAEDNVLNQKLAIDTLKDYGHVIELATNGQEAIERIKQKSFDLILMDINMPVMDGLQAANKIRMEMKSPWKDIPIIALTASATEYEIEKCMQAGMNDCIAKPFDPDLLDQKMQALVVKKQLNNQSSIDLSYLRNALNNKKESLKEIMNLFIKVIPPMIKEIESLYEQGKWKELGQAAHKIKSNLAAMGMNQAVIMTKKIETNVTHLKNKGKLVPIITSLVSACQGAVTELKAICKEE